MLNGGCFCGKLRYEAQGTPFHAAICHCADCRRVAGAPSVAWFTIAAADFRFVLGTPKRFASSVKAERTFCPDCGTPLTYQSADLPGEIDIGTATLDDPALVPPTAHVWTSEALPWVSWDDGLPSHSRSGHWDEHPA